MPPGATSAAQPPPLPGPAFEATLRLLRQRLHDYDLERARGRLGHAVVRGATAGLALRGGLHLASYIFGLLARRRARGAKPGNSNGRPGLWELIQDTLRWGAFLGGFAGVYVFSDEAIALLGGKKRTQAWRAMVSGALAGPTLLLTGPKNRHTSLAIYIFIRGLTLLARCGNLPSANPRVRALLAPTRWRHGDAALMCLSTMQIAYSWIIMPKTLPPSYNRFLNKHGGRKMYAYEGVRELAALTRGGRGPFRLNALQGTPQQHYCGTTPCEFLHPGMPCTTQILAFFPAAYLRALPVYLPVYVVPALLVHGRHLARPRTALHIWRKVGAGILRSSLFLSAYCTLAWAGVCTGFNLTGRTTPWVITGFAWVAGLACLFEKKSRRMELAMYVLSRVVEAFGLCLVEWGYVNPSSLPRRLDVLLFALATGAICHCYSDHCGQRRAVFRSKYLVVLDSILGNTGFEKASIRHVPSNTDLMDTLGLRISNSVQYLRGMAGPGSGGGNGGNAGGRRGSRLRQGSSSTESEAVLLLPSAASSRSPSRDSTQPSEPSSRPSSRGSENEKSGGAAADGGDRTGHAAAAAAGGEQGNAAEGEQATDASAAAGSSVQIEEVLGGAAGSRGPGEGWEEAGGDGIAMVEPGVGPRNS